MNAARQLRLVVLTPFAPRFDAPHGGGRSLAGFVGELSQRHRVALLCLRAADDPPTDELLARSCELVEEFTLRGVGQDSLRRLERKFRLLAGLARGRPLWVADTGVRDLKARLDDLVDSWRPDVVQAEFHVMGQYLLDPPWSGPARVLTEHEPGASAADEEWRRRRGPGRSLARLDAWAWHRYESRVLREVDATVAFTERDRQVLESLAPGSRVVRIPLGASVDHLPRTADDIEPNTLLFVGSFMHPPNVVAAERLAHRVMPLILDKIPDARLYLVGDGPPSSLRSAGKNNVVATGFVHDLALRLARAAVVIAPIDAGGGQRVKIFDALAAGKPLVATRRALEGFDLGDGKEVVLAETDEELAAATVRLLADEQARNSLASNARRWAEQNLGWDRSVALYEALYSELAREPRSRAPR